MRKPRRLLTCLASLTLLALACGGQASSSNQVSASTSLDLSESSNKLTALKSFRFNFTLNREFGDESSRAKIEGFGSGLAAALFASASNLKGEGAFVAPGEMQLNLNFDGKELGFVQVDGNSWAKYGSDWMLVTGSASLGLGQSPADLLKMLPQAKLNGGHSIREMLDGVQVIHYTFEKSALQSEAQQLAKNLGEVTQLSDARIEVWTTDDLVPLRLSMSLSGKDKSGGKLSMNFEMNISHINSSEISIKAPGS